MPLNTRPVEPFTKDRHLDLQADLHRFIDTVFQGKRILDVGAGLGQSKGRIKANTVTTYEPSPHCDRLVDICSPTLPPGPYDVVTAFEVLEHVEDDTAFLQSLDRLATQALFLTTPNWAIKECQSAHHYREYTHAEFAALLGTVWPTASIYYGAYFKTSDGGWCELLAPATWVRAKGLKHLALIDKALSATERAHLNRLLQGDRRW